MLKNIKKIHFVGIGGVGMSGLALYLADRGYAVSGSDICESSITKNLSLHGIKFFKTHLSQNVGAAEALVYSPCITDKNPEIACAKQKDLPMIKRGELLNFILDQNDSIAITGSHGKTTTSALCSCIFIAGKRKPTAMVGGELNAYGTNYFSGNSLVITELDESDGTFLESNPTNIVITNIDKEHLDYFKNMQTIISKFKVYLKKLSDNGSNIFYNIEDKTSSLVIKSIKKTNSKIFSYGLKKTANYYATDIIYKQWGTTFEVWKCGKHLGRINSNLMAEFNVRNVLAAVAVAVEHGLNFADIQKGVANFKGVKRRFEVKLKRPDILVVEDYAHHPTEIKVVLEIPKFYLKNLKRTIVIFQPHRFSRTKFLARDFAEALSLADIIVLTDVYPAFEKQIRGVGIDLIAKKFKNPKKEVLVLDKNKIPKAIASLAKKGDAILVLGAGNINAICDELVKRLINKK